MALWDSCLLYFPAKLLSGPEERHRDAYKSDPSKMSSIVGWMVVMASNPEQPDAFQLTDPVRGNAYKFRAGTRSKALEWVQRIKAAAKTQAPEVSCQTVLISTFGKLIKTHDIVLLFEGS